MKYNLNNKILEAINRGIKFALDDFEDQDTIQSQTNSKVKYQGGTKEWLDLMNDVVDLGLPSRTLWCKYNLGVDYKKLNENPSNSIPEEWYGKPYAWGKIKTQKVFEERTYRIDLKLSELTSEYDAAY
jgi:hypothetical protein